MGPDSEDREKREQELFGDLDRFFGQPPAPGSGGPEPTAPPDVPAQRELDEEDLLPAGWLPDVEDLDVGETAEAASSERGGNTGGPPEDRGETTAEMSADEWTRLRDALGEGAEAGDESPNAGAFQPAPERLVPQGAAGEPPGEDGEDEERELTLGDLRKPPAEYADLPGPDEPPASPEPEPPPAAWVTPDEEETDLSSAPDGTDWTETGPPAPTWEASTEDESLWGPAAEEEVLPEPVDAEVDAEEEGPPRAAWEETPTAEGWDRPAFEDVEAAANEMARGLRGGSRQDAPASPLPAPARRTVRVGEPEGMTGPSWEEPGAAAAPEAGPAWGGRNLPAALLSAVVLAAAALVSIAISPAAFAFVAGAVVLVGQAEFYASLQRRGQQPATALGLVVGGLILAAAYLRGEGAMVYLLALGLALSFLWYMAAPAKAREGLLTNVAGTMLGIVYVPFLAAYILVILSGPDSPRALTLSVLGLTFLYDAAAFAIGSLWGSRALAPTISPRKSWEGLIGATIIVFIVAIALISQVAPIDSVGLAVGLAVVVCVFAPLGDLAESALKRDLGIKDMGAILPGHGGILDRIDSVLFVAPAAFYFVKIFL